MLLLAFRPMVALSNDIELVWSGCRVVMIVRISVQIISVLETHLFLLLVVSNG